MLNVMKSVTSEKSACGGKIIYLIIVLCVWSSIIFSQNITNAVDVNGAFIIKDATTTFLAIDQATGNLTLSKIAIFLGADRFMHNFGTQNTFMGINTGNFTMTGYYNTGIGFNSLFANTTGTNNTALGWGSLFSNTKGYSNTAIGIASLYANTTGFYNSSVGDGSLYSNTTGNNNTALGIVSLTSNTTGFSNTAVGEFSLNQNTTGYHNTSVGSFAGYNIITGSNLTCIGNYAQPSFFDAKDQITLGDGYVKSLRCAATTITSLSDARDKKNIKDLDLGLNFLMKIKPRIYNWDKREWYENNKSDGSKMKEEPTAGFIAQELDSAQTSEEVEWLNLVLKDNPEKWEATPGNLLPILVKAIQDLKKENENILTNYNELKYKNEKLSAEVDSLKLISEKLVKLEQQVSQLNSVKYTSIDETKQSN